jgi:predicted RNA-binding protein YlxR (DUF448 family)
VAAPVRGSRPRHVPQRTCVACRQTNAKRQLVRVVRDPGGSVSIDPTGRRSGRGAYLCDSPECWQAALKRGVLPRALKIESIAEDDLQNLNTYAQRLSGTSEPVASSSRDD